MMILMLADTGIPAKTYQLMHLEYLTPFGRATMVRLEFRER